jgi:hypothetical protein
MILLWTISNVLTVRGGHVRQTDDSATTKTLEGSRNNQPVLSGADLRVSGISTNQELVLAAPQSAEEMKKMITAPYLPHQRSAQAAHVYRKIAYSIGFRPTISDTRPFIGPCYEYETESAKQIRLGTDRSDPAVLRGSGIKLFCDCWQSSRYNLYHE